MNLTESEIEKIQEQMAALSETLTELGVDSLIMLCEVRTQGGFSNMLNVRQGSYYAQRGMISRWTETRGNEDLAECLNKGEGEGQ